MRIMKAVYPTPNEALLFNFIHHSNALEHINVPIDDIVQTKNRTGFNPAAAGHFKALAYIFRDLLTNDRWPCNHVVEFENPAKSHTNLYWLREIHKRLMEPFTGDPAEAGVKPMPKGALTDAVARGTTTVNRTLDRSSGMNINDCGNYRLTPHVVGGYRQMPSPILIQPLLHKWFAKLGTFHLSVRDKVAHPDTNTLAQCVQMADYLALQIQTIHPFVDGSARVSRLVENALRLRWGIPWKITLKDDAISYVQKIMKYEDGPEWRSTLAMIKSQ